MQLMHNAMRKLQVWNQLLVICLNTPPWPTWGQSMHSYDQAPRPPLLIKSPNKGDNRLKFQCINYLLEVAQYNSGDPQEFTRPPK